MSTVKRILIKLHFISSTQFGFKPRVLLTTVINLPQYLLDFLKFRRSFSGKMSVLPCLQDKNLSAGTTNNEYFWQDLLVARWIQLESPVKHVDIGSRIDGFVAHVASYREIEVFDIRPITSEIPGIVFKKADLMDPFSLPNSDEGYCDSLSCLHALEHFGLGRYGDPINPDGYKLGIQNLSKLLKPGGTFYLSVPIGLERVEFNANWVFDPFRISNLVLEQGFKLDKLFTFGNGELLERSGTKEDFTLLSESHYNLGVFVFKKLAESSRNT